MPRTLELVKERSASLETCGYCPKLCRASCPVSNVEPRDSLTPWGKMSLSWFAARGDVEPDRELAATAWACTGCYACREACDHRNEVAPTLGLARADHFRLELAPAAAVEAARRFGERRARAEAERERLLTEPGVRADAETVLLVGCVYLRDFPAEARAGIATAARIFGGVRLLGGCCGAPLLAAGDRAGYEVEQARIRAALAGAKLGVALDPGCSLLLADTGMKTLVEHAAARIDLFRRVPGLGQTKPMRYHDPCQLGRGLGVYDPPRALLARALGRAPDEFARRREKAVCSGAGGLLPLTMPKESRSIAEARLSEHHGLGGGVVVTACASSLKRLGKGTTEVVDLMTVLEKSSRPGRGP